MQCFSLGMCGVNSMRDTAKSHELRYLFEAHSGSYVVLLWIIG